MSTLAYGGFNAADEWDALCYGENHPGTVQFLANQVSNIAQTLTEAGRNFMAQGQQLFEHYNGSTALAFAREVMSQVKGFFENPRVHTLWELEEMQSASLIMQRWIMANPTVRAMYHAQKCDGYSDTYVDVEPGAIGADHYDYRRVMDGVMVFGEDDWSSTTYLDRLKDGDRELLWGEKVDIMNTWTAMDVVMALSRDDPTSAVGGSL